MKYTVCGRTPDCFCSELKEKTNGYMCGDWVCEKEYVAICSSIPVLFEMTHCHTKCIITKIATNFEDFIADLQKYVAFSDATHDKWNPLHVICIHLYISVYQLSQT